MFLKILQNSQENICVGVSFLIKFTATLLKKRFWHRCFPVNFKKLLTTHFYRTPPGECFWGFWVIFTSFLFSFIALRKNLFLEIYSLKKIQIALFFKNLWKNYVAIVFFSLIKVKHKIKLISMINRLNRFLTSFTKDFLWAIKSQNQVLYKSLQKQPPEVFCKKRRF